MLDVERLEIEGVLLLRPVGQRDARGSFVETYNAARFQTAGIAMPFVQDNQAVSTAAGTIRGLHFQTPPAAQAKLVRVLRGSVFDVVVDLRRTSPTYGHWCGVTLDEPSLATLFIPSGLAHGYCTLEADTAVLYKVDHPYSAPHDAGLAWDDPDLAIHWPLTGAPIISRRDGAQPQFRDFVSPFP